MGQADVVRALVRDQLNLSDDELPEDIGLIHLGLESLHLVRLRDALLHRFPGWSIGIDRLPTMTLRDLEKAASVTSTNSSDEIAASYLSWGS